MAILPLEKKGSIAMNFVEKITDEQLKDLSDYLKQSTSPITSRRILAILLLEQETPAKNFELLTHYKRSVAVKIRKKFMLGGLDAIKSKKKEKESKRFLTRSQKAEIIKMLNESVPSDFWENAPNCWTTWYLAELIKDKYDVIYQSKTSLYLIFKSMKFSFRKPQKFSERRNEECIAIWKQEYEPIIQAECANPENIVLVGDEVIVTSQTRLQKAWIPSGNYDGYIQDVTNRKNASFYGFLNILTGEEIAYKAEDQTSKSTIEVLKNLAIKYPGKRIVLFWDNASWHKSQEVRTFLETVTNFKLYNFPPYAPDLNPQEHVWKEMKEKIFSNRLIKDFKATLNAAIEFLNTTKFAYKFFGVHGTFKV